jgi:hypothetical protein
MWVISMRICFYFILVVFSLFLIGCSAPKDVNFNEFYTQVIGFSENIENAKPIQQDLILMRTNEEFIKFKDEYFSPREIPVESPHNEKAVLYIQIPSNDSSAVDIFHVKSISVKDNVLTVMLKKYIGTEVHPTKGFTSDMFKWVMFIEIDKTYLKDNMKIVIKK